PPWRVESLTSRGQGTYVSRRRGAYTLVCRVDTPVDAFADPVADTANGQTMFLTGGFESLRERRHEYRRGSLENPPQLRTRWEPEKRPDESGRGRDESLRHLIGQLRAPHIMRHSLVPSRVRATT